MAREALVDSLRAFGMRCELREHQIQSMMRVLTPQRLSDRSGAIIADDMGLGKTITSIALSLVFQNLARIVGGHGNPTTLIAVPSPLVDQWCSELERFVAPQPGRQLVYVYRGARRMRHLPDSGDMPQFVLASYDSLKSDWKRRDAAPNPLWDASWSCVIADEAHDFRNPKTHLSHAMHALSEKSAFPLALTGTPVNNGIGDFLNLMKFCRIHAPSRAPRGEDVDRMVRAGCIVRRKRADVLSASDLPPVHTHTLYHPLQDGELCMHDYNLWTIVKSSHEPMSFARILVALLRARQCCVSMWMRDRPDDIPYVPSRIKILASIVSDVVQRGEKVLVFSQWATALREASTHLADMLPGVGILVFDGTLLPQVRARTLRDFCEGSASVLLLSYAIGNKGLNVTAANHVVFLDPWWNPFVQDQATGRCHRIGQQREVHVYRMIAKDTFEEYMYRVIQAAKRKASNLVLCETEDAGDGSAMTKGFSRRDLERAMGFIRACAGRYRAFLRQTEAGTASHSDTAAATANAGSC